MKTSAKFVCSLALVFLAASGIATAQWAACPNGIYAPAVVGVNTSTPHDMLHLEGTIGSYGWPGPTLRLSLKLPDIKATSQISVAHTDGAFSTLAKRGDLVIRTISSTDTSIGDSAKNIIISAQTANGGIHFSTGGVYNTETRRMSIYPDGVFTFEAPVSRSTEWSAPELQFREQDYTNYWAMMKRGSAWTGSSAERNCLLFTYGNGDPLAWMTSLQLYPNGNGQFFQNVGIGTVPQAQVAGSDRLHVAGRTRIGSNHPVNSTLPYKDYMLAVDGMIVAKEIYVEISDWAWPDFVFKKDYKLPSLEDVEEHIQAEGHLPGIPSAEEAGKNGFSINMMQEKLLQKVEELTLYMIELKKENKELREKISATGR